MGSDVLIYYDNPHSLSALYGSKSHANLYNERPIGVKWSFIFIPEHFLISVLQ